jgi:radical SAM protein with 4Fe4S-binding SPASM domain
MRKFGKLKATVKMSELNMTVQDAHVELTNTCNLHCSFCPTNKMKRTKCFLPFSMVRKIVDDNPTVKIFGLSNWGEPLLYPDLLGVIKFLKQKGKYVGLTTNATLLDEKTAEKLVYSGLDRISFSVDGVGKVYEKLRGANYKSVKNNILRFHEVNKARVHTNIMVTVSKENENCISQIKREWGKYSKIMLQPVLTYEKNQRKGRCAQLLSNHLVILSNGKVVPCCVDYDGFTVLGDIRTDTLNKLYNSAKMNKMRENSEGTICDFCSEYKSKFACKRFRTNQLLRKIKVTFST